MLTCTLPAVGKSLTLCFVTCYEKSSIKKFMGKKKSDAGMRDVSTKNERRDKILAECDKKQKIKM